MEIDERAIGAGLNGIAYPADAIVSLAGELGLEPRFSENCCSLVFEEVTVPLAGLPSERS